MANTLFALGVGPGDPELVTVKTARILSNIDIVFYPISSLKKESMALEIAKPYLKSDAELLPLSFPMEKDTRLLKYAWQKSAGAVLEKLEKTDCVFITLGDPSLYSTFGYLLESLYLKDEKINVQIVPGIISPTAAASEAKLTLASQDEKVAIIPVSTLQSIDELDYYIRDFKTLVLLKIGRRLGEIKDYLQKKELNAEIVFAKKVGLDGQKIANEIPSELLPDEGYFSLLIIKILK